MLGDSWYRSVFFGTDVRSISSVVTELGISQAVVCTFDIMSQCMTFLTWCRCHNGCPVVCTGHYAVVSVAVGRAR